MNFRELWVRWIVTPNSDEYFNWVMRPSPQSSKQENSMFPTKRSPGDGMSRVAYTTPKESCSKKSSVYIVKGSNFRPTGKKNQKSNKEQAFKTYNDYVSNLLDSTTNLASPQMSVGVRLSRIHFWMRDKRTPTDVCGEATTNPDLPYLPTLGKRF